MTRCPQCGAELIDGSTDRLCPACRMAEGLKTTETVQYGKFEEQNAAAGAALDDFGEYTLVRLIGEGGMGSVYLAQQTRPIRRQVALKVVRIGLDSRQVIARFESERQSLAMMEHPHIARVYISTMVTGFKHSMLICRTFESV
jgi:serine/threonine protein kinase